MKKVAVVGAGIAGLQASAILSELGYEVILFEKDHKIGGNLLEKKYLFPHFTNTDEVLNEIKIKVENKVKIINSTEIKAIEIENNAFQVSSDSEIYKVDTVLLSTGYTLFNAKKKEELGYGIYTNVITSNELERELYNERSLGLLENNSKSRVVFVHCVGSRDEKSGNHYCSKICCITAVKLAIQVRKQYPQTEIFCFYIDLRMYGAGYEELYREAQEKWKIQFIRGRVSEIAENRDTTIQVKAEDTLSGRPIKMNSNLVVLMTGMVPSASTKHFAEKFGATNGTFFLHSKNRYLHANQSKHKGLFFSGSCTQPMNVAETLSDARSTACSIHLYLKSL
ncbi:MAG: FAD-dependent oxidoreductase [Bacteroidales bacterium]